MNHDLILTVFETVYWPEKLKKYTVYGTTELEDKAINLQTANVEKPGL